MSGISRFTRFTRQLSSFMTSLYQNSVQKKQLFFIYQKLHLHCKGTASLKIGKVKTYLAELELPELRHALFCPSIISFQEYVLKLWPPLFLDQQLCNDVIKRMPWSTVVGAWSATPFFFLTTFPYLLQSRPSSEPRCAVTCNCCRRYGGGRDHLRGAARQAVRRKRRRPATTLCHSRAPPAEVKSRCRSHIFQIPTKPT